MLQMAKDFISNNQSAAMVIAMVIAFNMILSGSKSLLAVFKDKTESKVDDKVYAVLDRVLAISMKLLDFIGYNPKH
jgi:hypothetical protein